MTYLTLLIRKFPFPLTCLLVSFSEKAEKSDRLRALGFPHFFTFLFHGVLPWFLSINFEQPHPESILKFWHSNLSRIPSHRFLCASNIQSSYRGYFYDPRGVTPKSRSKTQLQFMSVSY